MQSAHDNTALCVHGLQRVLPLGELPDLTRPTFSTADAKHGVEHHIPTTGPPIAPAKLAIAKAEFTNMPYGDYRRLNVTTPDRYPVPHMQDYSAQLARKVIFCVGFPTASHDQGSPGVLGDGELLSPFRPPRGQSHAAAVRALKGKAPNDATD
ncbi:hypothetical protein AAFF_G00033890 [Aldrovandia affinis]|uniref:Uncharacterized protein n=1 Tax=Aldrovandia affinis TaxID=143900 RepID=A0AAD7S3Q9_9TELE|nr:hypothetical protein AAFF_G00033890 [Aldrovandia affinis]